MATDTLQDDELVKAHLRNHDRLVTMRAPWEDVWREIDERVNPQGAGGWDQPRLGTGTGRAFNARVRGAGNFDVTAVESLDRFAAAMKAITIPRNSQYIRLRFGDRDLDRLPAVLRWCETAADRLHAIRYAPHTGFSVQAGEDMRALGTYGTGAFWADAKPGLGLFYKSIHLSEIYIDEDFRGMVDTVHRRFKKTARQCEQQFGADALTPKMREAREKGKIDQEFDLLHVVCPNGDMQPDKLDRRAMSIDSVTIAVDEKIVLKRSGYHSMPISVSRHVTGPGDVYGQSPAVKVLPTIKGLNEMGKTILRSAHKMVDPALAFYDDDGITSLVTRPGGANPGLVSAEGRMLVQPMPTGGNLPIGLEMQNAERAIVKTAFLEDFFKILTDPSDRMTATQVLEMVNKQGVLVGPYAERYETEKQNPVTQRDLDLALRAGQVDPFPPEVIEAGGYPLIEYENPLSRMARAEEAAGLTHMIQVLAPLAQADPQVFDVIDIDKAAPGVADVLGVRPSWIRTSDEIAARRAKRSADQAAQQGVDQLAAAAGAYKDLAAGNAAAAGAQAA